MTTPLNWYSSFNTTVVLPINLRDEIRLFILTVLNNLIGLRGK